MTLSWDRLHALMPRFSARLAKIWCPCPQTLAARSNIPAMEDRRLRSDVEPERENECPRGSIR
jgi:hypothetical protein